MLLNSLALNPNSGNESSNQSAYGQRLVPELSFKCRLMNSGAGCAHEHHIFNNLTDTPANLWWWGGDEEGAVKQDSYRSEPLKWCLLGDGPTMRQDTQGKSIHQRPSGANETH